MNSFKLVYVVNSESYLYKRMALKRAKEVRLRISEKYLAQVCERRQLYTQVVASVMQLFHS